MSTTYDLICPETNEYIWIGQSDYIYKGKDHIKKLEAFLYAHEGKPLVFVSEHDTEYEECTWHDEWEAGDHERTP